MKLNLGRHPFSECWDGVYYKVLSDYPRITPHEIRDVLDFMAYEKAHGRSVEITADPPALREVLLRAAEHSEAYQDAPLPPILRNRKPATIQISTTGNTTVTRISIRKLEVLLVTRFP